MTVDFLLNFNLKELTGISSDILVLGLCILILILVIVMIRNGIKMSKLRKSYNLFMEGKNGQSLENIMAHRVEQMDRLIASDEKTQKKIQEVMSRYDNTYQKVGLVKYDAFNEMGGKLSFSLALLNRKNSGFIINAMHSREGCFTYIKEIVNGNSIIMLADEEKEALEMAMNDR